MYILRIQILQEKNELEKSDEMYLKGIHLNPKEQNQQYIGECFYLKSGVFTAMGTVWSLKGGFGLIWLILIKMKS